MRAALHLQPVNLTLDQRKALAARLRASKKVNTSLVDIEWHEGGMTNNKRPGTVYKATVKLTEGPVEWLVFLPAPRNCRQTALAVLCRHLECLTLGIKDAIVKHHEKED